MTPQEINTFCMENKGYLAKHYNDDRVACIITDKTGKTAYAIDEFATFNITDDEGLNWGIVVDYTSNDSGNRHQSKLNETNDAYTDAEPQHANTNTTQTNNTYSDQSTPTSNNRAPAEQINALAAPYEPQLSAYKVDDLTYTYESQCRSYQVFSYNCCTNPKSCLEQNMVDDEFMVSGTYLARELLKFQNTASQFSTAGGSISNSCGAIKNLLIMGAAVGTSIGVMCNKGRGKCTKTCGEVKDKALELARSSGVSTLGGRINCDSASSGSKTTCLKLKALIRNSQSKQNYCQNNLGQASAMITSQNLLTGVIAQKYALCEDSIEVKGAGLTANTQRPSLSRADCSTGTNASHPICIKCNANPKLQECAGVTTGSNQARNGPNPTGHQSPSLMDSSQSALSEQPPEISLGVIDIEDLPEEPSLQPTPVKKINARSISKGNSRGPKRLDGLKPLGAVSGTHTRARAVPGTRAQRGHVLSGFSNYSTSRARDMKARAQRYIASLTPGQRRVFNKRADRELQAWKNRKIEKLTFAKRFKAAVASTSKALKINKAIKSAGLFKRRPTGPYGQRLSVLSNYDEVSVRQLAFNITVLGGVALVLLSLGVLVFIVLKKKGIWEN